jgi:hypothetical protein
MRRSTIDTGHEVHDLTSRGLYDLDEDLGQEGNRELSKKLDAILSLIIVMGKQHLGWSNDWATKYLSEFDLSEECITEVTGATKDEVYKEKLRAKTRKASGKPSRPPKPSFFDHFKEE